MRVAPGALDRFGVMNTGRTRRTPQGVERLQGELDDPVFQTLVAAQQRAPIDDRATRVLELLEHQRRRRLEGHRRVPDPHLDGRKLGDGKAADPDRVDRRHHVLLRADDDPAFARPRHPDLAQQRAPIDDRATFVSLNC